MTYETLLDFEAAARTFMNDAARRYHQLAEAMAALEKHETAAAFRQLEAMERDAFPKVLSTAAATDDAGGNPDHRWVGDDDGDGLLPQEIAGSIYSLTPVIAINFALYNNQRALRHLTDVLAETPVDEIREQAGRLYREIFSQMVGLRLERRQVHSRKAESGLGADVAQLLSVKRDVESYRRYRDICLRRLGDVLAGIARTASGQAKDTILSLAESLPPSPPTVKPGEGERPHEGTATVRSIAAVEIIFDALLLAAQQSEDETLFRLAQSDANKLLPALRQLHDLTK